VVPSSYMLEMATISMRLGGVLKNKHFSVGLILAIILLAGLAVGIYYRPRADMIFLFAVPAIILLGILYAVLHIRYIKKLKKSRLPPETFIQQVPQTIERAAERVEQVIPTQNMTPAQRSNVHSFVIIFLLIAIAALILQFMRYLR